MRHLFKSLLIVSVIMTSSCTKDSIDDSIGLLPEENVYEAKFGVLPFNDQCLEIDTIVSKEFRFIYQNKEYSSPYVMNSNSRMIFSDQKISDLLSELNSIPTLATEFGKDGIVYFYDTDAERIKATEKRAKIEIQTRALSSFYIRGFKIVMWDKPKGRVKGGEYIEIIREDERFPTTPQPYSVPDLQIFRYGINGSSMVNFNDKISSIQMWIKAENSSFPSIAGLYQMA